PTDLVQPIPTSPIGNPDGDPTFTIWQPGEADLLPPLTPDPTFPGVFMFRTDFAAWSPANTLVEPIELRGYLVPAPAPPPSPAQLAAAHLAGAPLLPLRDVALQTVFRTLRTAGSPGAESQRIALAWRPDGKLLAAQPQIGVSSPKRNPTPHTVTLFDR